MDLPWDWLTYIVFHPEKKRAQIHVKAVALAPKGATRHWHGRVWVDKPTGNEDPFVLADRWAYTYCHATQLRRRPRRTSYVQPGSYLIFCSGDAADAGLLRVDTVFVVGAVAKWRWGKRPDLPVELQKYKEEISSEVWVHHLRFGIGKDKQHEGRYTYLSCAWRSGASKFSFLPVNDAGERAEFPIAQLPHAVRTLVARGIKGNTPVLLDDRHVQAVLNLIDECTTTKVVQITEAIGMKQLSGKAIACRC